MSLVRPICLAILWSALGIVRTFAFEQDPMPGGLQPAVERLPTIRDALSPAPPESFLSRQSQAESIRPGAFQFDSPISHAVQADPNAGDYWTHYGGKARAYYINDQRIEFTGMEASFAVEGVVDGGIHQMVGEWECMVEGQFFLNQPFDRNILTDTPFRQSFAHNFQVEPFQISQLYLAAQKNDLLLQAGRFVTPFGRFYFPLYLNNFADSPFIRSESILFRETGILAQWSPTGFVFTAALTNGGFERDTNSSKALIARVGIDRTWFACGASVKQQDGTSSEGNKLFNNHVGIDAMVRGGNWTLSGEVIYDEFGFRRPGFNLDNIDWGRSLYFRELNNGLKTPLTGVGYYVNLGYEGPRWTAMLNYGDFFPGQKLGVVPHDTPIHRGLFKLSYHFTKNLETYGIGLIENSVPFNVDNLVRKGTEVIAGCQFSL